MDNSWAYVTASGWPTNRHNEQIPRYTERKQWQKHLLVQKEQVRQSLTWNNHFIAARDSVANSVSWTVQLAALFRSHDARQLLPWQFWPTIIIIIIFFYTYKTERFYTYRTESGLPQRQIRVMKRVWSAGASWQDWCLEITKLCKSDWVTYPKQQKSFFQKSW